MLFKNIFLSRLQEDQRIIQQNWVFRDKLIKTKTRGFQEQILIIKVISEEFLRAGEASPLRSGIESKLTTTEDFVINN